ncbi:MULTISPECIES: DUF3558 domain-containing protein [unclassified Streptomyces]|uniref:DUF3558 domain-containing protein n=1 Tax=Streptomyces sp. NBC_00119 TaxID=2975659 RepID=A0AAU1UA03_9ACTN|nr:MULTISPECIES: DUF3558 domain-containing protein [unclassified Streptomyces]MCX4643930.1 DUF3558 domain-containing protein [Streptomyces sp. NBC_01446]MCX5325040.1 DUF3558 domain-containing protein [Streptomyces sp. NBC_00120]
MQRKAYVPGVAALLAALLTGCTGGSGATGDATDSKPGDVGTSAVAARPGKYRTLPEPCRQLDKGTLDKMLPGIKELPEGEQRDKAYEGAATVTYDTDRRVGCRWKDDGGDATHRLLVDFERVVSYDNTVSDDTEAGQVFASKRTEAHLPEPVPTDTTSPTPSHSPSAGTDENAGDDTEKAGKKSGRTDDEASDEVSDDTSSSPSDDSAPDAELQPRALEGLADEAFLDDQLTARASAGGHRTVTVVFRTSNVIVTVEYEQQPGPAAKVPDSKEMQDRARELARKLAGTLGG